MIAPARYPGGGGAAAAAGEAFGEVWAFVPIGALIVDFVLTIAISTAAGASAVIAYVPGVARCGYRWPSGWWCWSAAPACWATSAGPCSPA